MTNKSNDGKKLAVTCPSQAQLERNLFVTRRVSSLLKELDDSIESVCHTIHPSGAESGVVIWRGGRVVRLSIDNMMSKRAVLAAYLRAAGISLDLL